MGVNHPGRGGTEDLLRQVQQVAVATIQNAAVGRAGIRVYDGGWIRIEGGGLSVTGQATVSGDLFGTSGGTLDWLGNVFLRGPTLVEGTLNVTGNSAFGGSLDILGSTDITGPLLVTNTLNVTGNSAFGGTLAIQGATTLNNDLTVGTGRIVVGPLILDKAGGYGARVYSGGTLLLDGGTNVVVGAPLQATGGISSIGNITAVGNLSVTGDVGGVTKSFWIEHPTKPGKSLRHGSLEGPEHGVYYRGVVEFNEDGEAVFELPDYFTALVLPDDIPTVQVTASGRPFLTGAEPVDNGRVTVYGERNREAHVTVTAARGLFDVEPDKEAVVTDLP